MAEKFRYALKEEARLLYSSIAQKSTPRGYEGKAEPKYNATFGIGKIDFDEIVKLEVNAIKAECGDFTGSPADYYLACTSGETAAKRVLAKADLDARGKTADEAFKSKEKAEKRAALYREYSGILTASSKFGIGLARLENGAVVTLAEDHDKDIAPEVRDRLGKEYFYPGAWVVPNVSLEGFKRKTVDARDGVTAYLQNLLYIRRGESLGGSGPANSEVFGGFAGYSPVDPTALAPDGAGTAGPADAEPGGF